MNAETLLTEIEDRIDSCENSLEGLKLYDLHKKLYLKKQEVEIQEDIHKDLRKANGKVDSKYIKNSLDETQENLEEARRDLNEHVDVIERILEGHDEGQDMVDFINEIQREKAGEMVERGEIGMGNQNSLNNELIEE